jgi:hypothetical protein
MTSIDRLSEAYQDADLQPRNLQLMTDQEADAIFIRYRENFWTFIFWTIFAASILFIMAVGK